MREVSAAAAATFLLRFSHSNSHCVIHTIDEVILSTSEGHCHLSPSSEKTILQRCWFVLEWAYV